MSLNIDQLPNILEAAILAAGHPLSLADMQKLFDENAKPTNAELKQALQLLKDRYQSNGIELVELGSGYQFQAKTEYSNWLQRLWEERPQRYSRAILETLALIAYRQPITRAEVEEVRGVGVSSHIVKTLLEREWVRVIGYRDVPGKPALYGTTKAFLDHFNLKSLNQLPTLAEIADLDSQEAKLQMQLELTPEQAETSLEIITETETPSETTDEISDTEVVNSTEESPSEHE